MRRLTMALALAATSSAVCLAAAPTAMAHQFTASRLPKTLSTAEPGKTRGRGVGSSELGGEERGQEFKFGPFTVVCAAKASAKTIAEGAVSWSASTIFATEIKFEKCLTKANYGSLVTGTPTTFNFNPETKTSTPVKFVYHANGYAQTGTGAVAAEAEVAPGSATFAIANKVCKIAWPSQTMPVTAVKFPEEEYFMVSYASTEVPVAATQLKKFPSGFQQRLLIANAFKNFEWRMEEGQCLGEGGFEREAKQQEGKTGVYKGSIEEEVLSGNIGFE